MLALDPRLAAHGRLSAVGSRLAGGRAAGVALLVLAGIAAGACTSLLQLELRMPGHAILRGVVPMALGLSLVPRRGGATVMAAAAGATVLALGGGRANVGPGALTSLLLLGPLLDVALARPVRGIAPVVTFTACGLLVNLVAFCIRLADKIAFPHGSRPVAAWWPGALGGYALCGAIAGLVAAALFFRGRAAQGAS